MTISLTPAMGDTGTHITWALDRWRQPTVLAMGQNRQKTSKTCLLTPSGRSGRLGPQ
ncbi:MAG: hypothetical protein NT154_16565 [Verrucomicrobia bacterium]|nr:hypothetical protein [Verrucomicrobiota bacterium]